MIDDYFKAGFVFVIIGADSCTAALLLDQHLPIPIFTAVELGLGESLNLGNARSDARSDATAERQQ